MTLKYPFLSLKTLTEPIAAELKVAAGKVIDSGWYVMGENVARFEQSLAQYCHCSYAVGVSNGLDALRLIFRAYIELGVISPGDEVIVPANTYVASILAITDSGLRPVFAEPDPTTMNLDIDAIEPLITSRTRAILVVHLYGTPCWSRKLMDIRSRYALKIIEDNAQAIGAMAATPGVYGALNTGALGDAAGNSFYPTKNLGALGDAGAVTTSDPLLADTVRALLNYGSDRRYHNIYRGLNCRLDEMQAAILNVKLNYLEAENAHRRTIARIYKECITNPAILKPAVEERSLPVWHQYVLRTNERDRFRAYLTDNGIGSDILYPVPPHRQPCYVNEYGSLSLPITNVIADSVVSIPVSSMTSPADARQISSIINGFK
ncbi:MAG: DegT/DnrJ/EryC1/StrS family aminotransferase [Muribaculaceae bacterium]